MVNADCWYCDIGASYHITPNKYYFSSYEKFPKPQRFALGKKNVTMYANGKGDINVVMFWDKNWYESGIKIVWYVPDANAHLFSVKPAAQNGFNIALNEKEVIIRRKDYNSLAATGYLKNNLYVMSMKVVKPGSHVNLVTPTLQLYHKSTHLNKQHVKKSLKDVDIEIENENEQFCDCCAIGKMHRLPFKTRKTRSEPKQHTLVE